MLKNISIMLMIILFIGCSNTPNVPDTVELTSWQDSVSYSLGSDVGTSFKSRGFEYERDDFFRGFVNTYLTDTSYAYGASLASNLLLQGIEVDPTILLRGFETTTSGDSLLLTSEEINQVISKYNTQLREAANEREKKEGEKSKLEGEAFIEQYKVDNADAVETESGLVYRVITEGFGEMPTDEDRVVVHYTGKLINDSVFDSSVERGEPTTFRVGGVIPGWQEAMKLMNVGSKWELVIPSDIAYGERATGGIPANSTLIFEVELLGIE